MVVDALKKAGQEDVPVIGTDNNKFLEQLEDGAPGAAVTNPATIGGVGTAIALQALNGEEPEKVTTLTPEVWDMETSADTIEEFYDPAASADVLDADDHRAVHDLHPGAAHRLRGAVGQDAPIRARA